MKKHIKKILSIFMIVGMLFQTFAPTIVFATTFEDGNNLTIGGNPTINGSTFEYSNGDVTITKNGASVNTTSFVLEEADEIVITLAPDEGYTAQLHNDVGDYDVALDNNTYSFTVGLASENGLLFTPSFVTGPQEPGGPEEFNVITYDFTINGESFTNVTVGDMVTVSNSFNMDTLSEFYITKIAIEDGATYTYEPDEYSYELLDNQDRKIFETAFTKVSNNSATIRVESHSNDILDKDIADGKTRDHYYGFYITNIYFVKEAFKGVAVSTTVMPDNYDFTTWNGADLSDTTISNPGIVTAYYGENTIAFSSIVSSNVAEISLVSDSGIPSSAVDINNETGEITVLSNYYNEIPLQIRLEDGTIGYMTINRIGIFISDLNVGNDTLYHGASFTESGNLAVDTDKYRVAAVFYHEDTTTYEDYDLIVNITYEDGSTETTIAQGVGDVHNSSGNITGSDYILWKGNSNTPKKISVTAVTKDALSNENTFGGATFGSGAGVEWTRSEGGNN